MNCVVCNKEIVLIGEDNPTFLLVSKYWSFEKSGEKRPYCGADCGLSEYTHDLAEKDTPHHKP